MRFASTDIRSAGRAGPTRAASVVSRRYISIPEAAEYLGVSTKFVRNLIMEGEIKGYRIGSYGRHRTLRVDLDEIDEKLMQPVGPYWNDPSAKPRKRTNNNPVPDRSVAIGRIDPLDETYYRFCTSGHQAIGDHTPGGVGACHARAWVNIPGRVKPRHRTMQMQKVRRGHQTAQAEAQETSEVTMKWYQKAIQAANRIDPAHTSPWKLASTYALLSIAESLGPSHR